MKKLNYEYVTGSFNLDPYITKIPDSMEKLFISASLVDRFTLWHKCYIMCVKRMEKYQRSGIEVESLAPAHFFERVLEELALYSTFDEIVEQIASTLCELDYIDQKSDVLNWVIDQLFLINNCDKYKELTLKVAIQCITSSSDLKLHQHWFQKHLKQEFNRDSNVLTLPQFLQRFIKMYGLKNLFEESQQNLTMLVKFTLRFGNESDLFLLLNYGFRFNKTALDNLIPELATVYHDSLHWFLFFHNLYNDQIFLNKLEKETCEQLAAIIKQGNQLAPKRFNSLKLLIFMCAPNVDTLDASHLKIPFSELTEFYQNTIRSNIYVKDMQDHISNGRRISELPITASFF